MAPRGTSTKGFKRTGNLLTGQIRRASEGRGFAQSRLLTHWAEIVGQEVADIAHPVEITYGRGGMGATLTVLTKGAHAPMLEMQKDNLRERVNRVYGYNAIARVRITQTAATGFAEGQIAFDHRKKAQPIADRPELRQKAAETASPVTDNALREALARLGENILKKDSR